MPAPIVKQVKLTCLVALVAARATSALADPADIGEKNEQRINAQSQKLFGFNNPLNGPETMAVDRVVGQSAMDRQALAGGLSATFVARNVGYKGDMFSFWPNDYEYTHLIACIEHGREDESRLGEENIAGENPAVQRINLSTGEVKNILYGMDRCDGIRTTPWGTVLADNFDNDDCSGFTDDLIMITGFKVKK